MSSLQSFSAGAARFGRWYRQGVVLWLRVPFRLALAYGLILLVEFLLQLIPTVGTLVSKAVVSCLVAAVCFAYSDTFAGRRFGWDVIARAVRQPLAVYCGLILIGFAVFAVQVAVTITVFGPDAFDATVWGHLEAHPQLNTLLFACVLIPAGSIPDTILLLAPPLMVLRQVGPARAFFQSAAAFFHWSVAFGLLLLCTAAVTTISIVLLPLLLVSLPLLGAIGFAAYADVVGVEMAPLQEPPKQSPR